MRRLRSASGSAAAAATAVAMEALMDARLNTPSVGT